jgi:hypothetical protein
MKIGETRPLVKFELEAVTDSQGGFFMARLVGYTDKGQKIWFSDTVVVKDE